MGVGSDIIDPGTPFSPKAGSTLGKYSGNRNNIAFLSYAVERIGSPRSLNEINIPQLRDKTRNRNLVLHRC